ncbi:MAG: hypothetical protein LBR60_00640 [Fibrobacter sp.]|nr:hypothetical protein [Fibrobacter sp.]
MKKLDRWLNPPNREETNKKIFVAYRAAKELHQISQQTGLGLFQNFKNLHSLKKTLPNGYGFHKSGNIYVHTHLSNAISDDVLQKIAQNI